MSKVLVLDDTHAIVLFPRSEWPYVNGQPYSPREGDVIALRHQGSVDERPVVRVDCLDDEAIVYCGAVAESNDL